MRVILVTKDAMYRGYLHQYGGNLWKTPNIDELASKGTVCTKYYTGAASTLMANISMFTGDYPFHTDLKDYGVTNKKYPGKTLFDKSHEIGFKNHIIWDEAWFSAKTIEYYDCYGENVTYHPLKNIRQGVGGHYHRTAPLLIDKEKTESVYNEIDNELSEIFTDDEENIFVWLHVPHVINGFTGYGEDLEAFDHIVGIARKYVRDENVFVSADHGNMNGIKGNYNTVMTFMILLL